MSLSPEIMGVDRPGMEVKSSRTSPNCPNFNFPKPRLPFAEKLILKQAEQQQLNPDEGSAVAILTQLNSGKYNLLQ